MQSESIRALATPAISAAESEHVLGPRRREATSASTASLQKLGSAQLKMDESKSTPIFRAGAARFNVLPIPLPAQSFTANLFDEARFEVSRNSTASTVNAQNRRVSLPSISDANLLLSAMDEADISQRESDTFTRLFLSAIGRSREDDRLSPTSSSRVVEDSIPKTPSRSATFGAYTTENEDDEEMEDAQTIAMVGRLTRDSRGARRTQRALAAPFEQPMEDSSSTDSAKMDIDTGCMNGGEEDTIVTIPAFPWSDTAPEPEDKSKRGRQRKSDKPERGTTAAKSDHPYEDCQCLKGVRTAEANVARDTPIRSTHGYMTIVESPAYHQVKDFNLLPHLQLSVRREAGIPVSVDMMEKGSRLEMESLKREDYITIRLVSEKSNPRTPKCPIFLAAVPVLYRRNETEDIILSSLKVTQSMLPGRTKGFKFYLLATLIHNDQQVDYVLSHPFLLWSNVNQVGFPREDRAHFLKARIEQNKKRRGKSDSDSADGDDGWDEEIVRAPKVRPRLAKQKSAGKPVKKEAVVAFDFDEEEPRSKRRKMV